MGTARERADGLAFDAKGNMYCGLFGDGQVFRTSFNTDGSVRKTERIINPGTDEP
jgi:hypothetical protein